MWEKCNLKQFKIRQKQQNVKKMKGYEYFRKALYIFFYMSFYIFIFMLIIFWSLTALLCLSGGGANLHIHEFLYTKWGKDVKLYSSYFKTWINYFHRGKLDYQRWVLRDKLSDLRGAVRSRVEQCGFVLFCLTASQTLRSIDLHRSPPAVLSHSFTSESSGSVLLLLKSAGSFESGYSTLLHYGVLLKKKKCYLWDKMLTN